MEGLLVLNITHLQNGVLTFLSDDTGQTTLKENLYHLNYLNEVARFQKVLSSLPHHDWSLVQTMHDNFLTPLSESRACGWIFMPSIHFRTAYHDFYKMLSCQTGVDRVVC